MHNYKIILSQKMLYREFELEADTERVLVGTDVGNNYRLYRELFFEPVNLTFVNSNGTWNVFCTDNLYFSNGSSRKLITLSLNHGDVFTVKYQNSDIEAFTVEFLIDFNNESHCYERAIDLSGKKHINIGAKTSDDIVLSSEFIHNDEIEIQVLQNKLNLSVQQTTYGVFLNGSKVLASNFSIADTDFFAISDYLFYYRAGVLWTEIRDDMAIVNLEYEDHPCPNAYPRFVRNTRVKSKKNSENIEILNPSSKPQKNVDVFNSLLSSFGMLATSGIMAYMGGSMIALSIVSGSMALITSISTIVQGNLRYKKEVKERIESYHNYIDGKRIEITESRNQERDTLESIYIDANTEISRVFEFSSDLFDRMTSDEDFLSIRLGTGNVPALRKIDYKKQEQIEPQDEIQQLPGQIADEYFELTNAPVFCSLKENNSIGIVGTEHARFEIMKNMVVDICVRQYYSDVELFFISESNHSDRIKWLRFLPFVSNEQTNVRNIACDKESRNRTFDYLYKELSQRKALKDNHDLQQKYIVVFFYDECGFQKHPISKFYNELTDLQTVFIFMGDSKAAIPLGCTAIAFLESENEGYILNTDDGEKKTKFLYPHVDDTTAQSIVNFLAPVYTEEVSLEGELTKSISFFEMLEIFGVEDLNLSERWNKSKVYKSMAVPIGVTRSGIVYLDLHDKAHGPHGLVAGTTGSGKSEVLQTYILSIATSFHPYEVAFVIIDFKGGGMVNQFKELPHLLGAITNIDGKEINRSLKSIKAELQKRQRLFAEAQVNHIDKYIQKYKDGDVDVPIPHLILIVDEFAELKAEQPDFMKELISAARIGRSLGVHLILATQKPSGQVDEQIWSNSKFKLCLKVQSQEDSNEVLKSPLAAEIKEPGRAYFQVGNNEIFELFQSAYSGAPEKMSSTDDKEYALFSVDEAGRRKPIFVKKKQEHSDLDKNQLESVVDYVSAYCKTNNIVRQENICLPSLPKFVSYQESRTKSSMVPIGIFDDPDNQVQDTVFLDVGVKNTIIIGASQYGKTNILQLIIRSISSRFSPEEANIYILDFGSTALKNFENLNHVGGVVCSSDDEKLKNLFKLLFSEIAERKEKMVAAGVSSFSSYLEAGFTDIPQIYLLIDNLTALIELYLQDDDSLLNIVREGLAVGISTIATNVQTSGIGFRYMANFANKIALYCNDSSEYMNLYDNVNLFPDEVPGRCIMEIDKKILECQTYLAFAGEKEIERVEEMQKLISDINQRNANHFAKPIPFIPSILEYNDMTDSFGATSSEYNIPIGLTYSEVEPYYLDISQLKLLGLCGKENTGHRNFIKYIMTELESNMAHNPVRVVVFDDFSRKYDFLKNNPAVALYTLNIEQIDETLREWHSILSERYDRLIEDGTYDENAELLLMLIQNNDVAKKISDDFELMELFNEIISRFSGMKVAFIFTDFVNASLSYDAPEPLRMIKDAQHLILFDNLDNLKPFEVAYEYIRDNRKKLETGDAYYLEDNMVTKLKLVKATDADTQD